MRKIIFGLVFFSFIIFLPYLLKKSGFYIVNKPVVSNKLIIEGWLNPNFLDKPPFNYSDYDTIFVVGTKKPSHWNSLSKIRNEITNEKTVNKLWLATDGFIFLKKYNEKLFTDTITNIQIIAKGTKANGKYPHLFLMVKDSVLGHTFVKGETDTFSFNVKLVPGQLEFLNIYFNNDMLTITEDINLTVYGIKVDSEFFFPVRNELFYFYLHQHSLINSNAAETANYLRSLELKAKVIVIDTLYRNRNKTLAAARTFSKYLKKEKINISSINVYTLDFHSRRTRLAYRKALGNEIQIGTFIKVCPECLSKKEKNFKSSYYQALDEFVSWFLTLLS